MIEINKEIAQRVLDVVDKGLVNGMGVPEPGKLCVEAAVCYALGLPHGDDPQCVDPVLRSLKIRLNDSNWSSKAARAKGLRRLAVIQLGSKGALDQKQFAMKMADLACRTSVPIALRAAASIHKDPKHKAALLEAANRCEISPNREAAEHAKKIANSASADASASASASAVAYASAYASAYADASAYASAYAYADASAYASAVAYASASASASAVAYASASASADAYAYASAYADAYAYASARDKILSDFAEGVVQILVEMNVPGVQWLELTEIAA